MMKLIFSGFGGQGILTLGQIVATIAMNKGKKVTWMPSYGVEMRGGTANCTVIISDHIIGNPIVKTDFDVLCALNTPSIVKFLPKVRPGGLVLVNSSIVNESITRDDVDAVYIDATNIALEVGSPKVQNMVMVAGLLMATDLFSTEDIRQVLEEKFRESNPALIALNMAAVERGGKAKSTYAEVARSADLTAPDRKRTAKTT